MFDVENNLRLLLAKYESLNFEMDHTCVEIKVHATLFDIIHILSIIVEALEEKLTVYLAFKSRRKELLNNFVDCQFREGYVRGAK